jgi:hypothetical protein
MGDLHETKLAILEKTGNADVRELVAEVRCLRHELNWEDVDDEWSEAIARAHPTLSGSHDAWGTAMNMVGHRHSKWQLVALVNWLLVSKKSPSSTGT